MKGNMLSGANSGYYKLQRRAFNCVSHRALLQNMYHYGVQRCALDLLQSYLDRDQIVIIWLCTYMEFLKSTHNR